MVDNSHILSAMHALFEALGPPTSRPLSPSERTDMHPERFYEGFHPVFELMETFGPGDAGYTHQFPRRGGHSSLPVFVENGGIVVIETYFHKGDMTIERLDYGITPAPVFKALYALLEGAEVRD
ncbi:hypothetical protein R4P70_32215 [Rhodococcus sp. IEGM 1241]|uniref:hypothetical protein n=1 Tax=Rhodococcus sp. IEGM 1241 TaxID=3082228 RepID=UPI0029556B73|nr:hypothetical protein [Rhodococcus sp. IEGM 1241]MDV8015979.1 hypothetical protein [Rhodococcus sp. IEGM 1241]